MIDKMVVWFCIAFVILIAFPTAVVLTIAVWALFLQVVFGIVVPAP